MWREKTLECLAVATVIISIPNGLRAEVKGAKTYTEAPSVQPEGQGEEGQWYSIPTVV